MVERCMSSSYRALEGSAGEDSCGVSDERLRVEVLFDAEFGNRDRAHEREAERLVDSDGDGIGREETELLVLPRSVDVILDVLVQVVADDLAETPPAQITSHIDEAEKAGAADFGRDSRFAVITHDAAGGHELACRFVEIDEGLVESALFDVAGAVLPQHPEEGRTWVYGTVVLEPELATIQIRLEG